MTIGGRDVEAILDTHAFLWWLASDAKLSEPARKFIGKEENKVYLSAASAWEIATKVRIGKRLNEIGSISGGADGASDKAESRRQRRIREKVKQLEGAGEKQSRIEAINDLILQAGLNITAGSYFVTSAVVGVVAGLGALVGGLGLLSGLEHDAFRMAYVSCSILLILRKFVVAD